MVLDPDNPEWTTQDFERAVGPEGLSDAELAAFPRTRGRPRSDAPKRQVTLRLSAAVLDHFKSRGPGWQSRIDAALLEAVKADGGSLRK